MVDYHTSKQTVLSCCTFYILWIADGGAKQKISEERAKKREENQKKKEINLKKNAEFLNAVTQFHSETNKVLIINYTI